MNNPIPVVAVVNGNTLEAPAGSVPLALYQDHTPPSEIRSHGSFYDIETQPLTASTNHTILLRQTYLTRGVHIENGSQVTFDDAGVYDIQFSLQVASTTNQTRNLRTWGRRNGLDLEHSAGRISITEQNNVIVPTWNYHLEVEAGDYFELVCRVSGDQVSLLAEPNGGPYPAVPSAILTVQQVDV